MWYIKEDTKVTLRFRADSGVGATSYYAVLVVSIYGAYTLYRREFASEVDISVSIWSRYMAS